MKDFIEGVTMPGLTWKQKATVWYFVVSLCLLGSVAEAPIWFLIVLVLNFANAARLIRKVPITDPEEDTQI